MLMSSIYTTLSTPSITTTLLSSNGIDTIQTTTVTLYPLTSSLTSTTSLSTLSHVSSSTADLTVSTNSPTGEFIVVHDKLINYSDVSCKRTFECASNTNYH